MDEQKPLRRVIVVSMVMIFVITTIFFAFLIKPNIDQISFLRENRYGGHPKAIKANVAAEWREIGGKAVQYLLINGVALGVGFFIIFSLRPRSGPPGPRKKDEASSDN